jgi:RHS repeat-associated protein
MSVYDENGVDNVNPVNGNLYLDIPLLGYPQLGHQLNFSFHIYYNDKRWNISNWYTVFDQSGHDSNHGQWSWTARQSASSDWPKNMGVYVAPAQHLDFGADLLGSAYIGNNEGYSNGVIVTPNFSTAVVMPGGSGYQQYFVSVNTFSSFVSGPDGAKHYYGDASFATCSTAGGGSCPNLPSPQTNIYPANDGSGYVPSPVAPLMGSGGASTAPSLSNGVRGADGVQFTVDGNSGFESVTDTSGNSISQTANGWTDSVGRSIQGSSTGPGFSSPADVYTYQINSDPVPGTPTSVASTPCSAASVAARVWTVPSFAGGTQNYYFCYSTASFNTQFNLPYWFPDSAFNLGYSYSPIGEASGTTVVLSAILLPNGTSYTFAYDNYLSLSQLGLPTGGSIAYQWQNVPFAMGPPDLSPYGGGNPMFRALKSRTVNPGGNSSTNVSNNPPPRTWYYSWYNSSSPGNRIGPGTTAYSVVTDPMGNDTERQLGDSSHPNMVAVSTSHYSGCSPHDAASFDPTFVPHCVGNGVLLSQEQDQLENYAPPTANLGVAASSNAVANSLWRPTSVTNTIPTGTSSLVNQTAMSYTPNYGTCVFTDFKPAATYQNNQTPYQTQTQTVNGCSVTNQIATTQLYDFGVGQVGPLLKTQSMVYTWQNDLPSANPQGPTCQNASGSGYLSANLLTLPECVITQAGAEDSVASGTWLAETDYAYDQSPSPTALLGNLTSTTFVLGAYGTSPTTTTAYDSSGMPVSKTDARGAVTTIGYDSTGIFPSTVTYPTTAGVAHSESFTFDPTTGRTTSHTDQNHNVTTYGYFDVNNQRYDPLNRLRSITMPPTVDGTSGQTAQGGVSYTYQDTPGSLAIQTATKQSTGVSVFQGTYFDGLGEVLETELASDSQGPVFVDTSYDNVGRVSTVTNPYRSTTDSTYGVTTKSYDALDRIVQLQHPDNSIVQWCYNGLPSSTTPGRSPMAYAQRGPVGGPIHPAPTKPCNPKQSTKAGTWVDMADEQNIDSQRTTDAGGRLVAVMEPNPTGSPSNLETDYGYDALGNLLNVNQVGNSSLSEVPVTRSFQYDPLSRLVYSTNPETGYICYGQGSRSKPCAGFGGYDANSNLLYRVDGNARTISYTYDELNRLTSRTGLGINDTYTYDQASVGQFQSTNAVGRLVNESNNINAYRLFAYDAMGRVSNQADCHPLNCGTTPDTTSAAYDLAGNMTSLTYPDGRVVSQTFDGAGRLSSVNQNGWVGNTANPSFLYLVVNAYDPVGHVNSATMGNGVTMTATYNNRQETSSLAYATAINPGTPLWSKNLNWTLNGNLASAVDNVLGMTRQFGYDSLNRLTGAQDYTGTGTSLMLNPSGLNQNFSYDSFGNIQQTGNSFQFSPSYLPNNRMANYPYDNAGNLLGDLLTNTLQYDGLERVTTLNGGLANGGTSYFYLPSGERISKSSASVTMDTISFGGRPIARATGQGQWTDLIYGANGLLAEVPGTVASGPSYRLLDHLGTEVGSVDASGVTTINDYAPFGQSFNGSDIDPYKFTGKERDSESGLDYFGARYYGSSMGRFMSPDWSKNPTAVPYAKLENPQSLNLYEYVGNNPLSRSDLDGHFWLELLNRIRYGYWTRDTAGAREAAEFDSHGKYMALESRTAPLRNRFVVSALIGVGAGGAAGAAGDTAAAGEAGVAAEVGGGWVRVGRWMSQEELQEMQQTGKAVESNLGGSRVADPADPSAYKNAPSGSVYVEYDIPAGSATSMGNGWSKIPGPNSTEGRLATRNGDPAPQMPPVRNIEVKVQK